MIEINLNGVKKSFGYKNVLDGFSLDIMTNDRIALIGSNGSGKTTIFNMIVGYENVGSGRVSIKRGASIGLFSQLPPVVLDETRVIDVLTKDLLKIYETEQKMKEYENELATTSGERLTKILKKYGDLQQIFEQMGGYEVEARISKICNGFKISKEMLARPFNHLSGGEKTIVNLASLIISKPSILLLDEPTNHLDIETLEWLEEYLKGYHGTIVISSHDRYFLDKICTKTVYIYRGKEEVFFGNYSYYLKENERRIMNEFADFKNQQKQIESMKKKIHQLHEWGKLAFPGGEAFFKRATSIQKRLDKIELLDRPEQKKEIPLQFQITEKSGQDVLHVHDLEISIGNNVLFDGVNFSIRYGEKVCLMGKNGSGKSMFLKALLGTITHKRGNIKIGSKVSIGYIPQEIVFENEHETILEVARKSYFIGTETELRASLAKFLFSGEIVFKRIGKLSGGEKVRLKLFELIHQKANLLILDEPTNHIDIDTKEILEEALQEYSGTILFVSHDRYFINKIAERILSVENKTIVSYIGNYDDYKKTIN